MLRFNMVEKNKFILIRYILLEPVLLDIVLIFAVGQGIVMKILLETSMILSYSLTG